MRIGSDTLSTVYSGTNLFSVPGGSSPPWIVLHTRSRQEKVVSAELTSLGLTHYLPLVGQVKHYGSRKVQVTVPLFPGYVFVRGLPQEVFPIDRNKRLVNIIPVIRQAELNWELKNLNLALVSKVCLDPFAMLTKGIRVEVKSGPLRGLQGLVENREQDRMILQVEMLGRAMSLEIRASLLEPI